MDKDWGIVVKTQSVGVALRDPETIESCSLGQKAEGPGRGLRDVYHVTASGRTRDSAWGSLFGVLV